MAGFVFKPFEEMTPDDYAEIGFKSGLEIHQQLITGKKLFCRCPAGKYSTKFDAEILRHMRPTLSELGEYDGTALMEFKTKKEIIYRINNDTVCTYEMDDTPPFELNEEALDIALGIGLLYECKMIDELHIARKQYLDGSIPTGFQRTTIVGVDGRVPYAGREIRIVQLGLEEDACREVSDFGHRRVYLTDRLSMPLIETVTAPDMRTPQEVAEVAQILRRLVRSTGKVRTGIGAARQDVNVSVTGGTRVEIKGVPRIPRIPRLTYNEAMRQWNLLRLREELARRGITPATFGSAVEEVTRAFRKTVYQPIQSAVSAGMPVFGVRLKGFRGLLRWQTQTSTYFSQEISDRVRVIACLTALPNIVQSDNPGETISSAEWQMVKKALGAGDDDTVVVVWGPPDDALMGAQEVVIRAREAAQGIPSETRQALADGTNGFERILPGPDRMYPDTDLPPKRIRAERLETIKDSLPAHILARESWYGELGVPADLREFLSVSPWAPLFEVLVREWGIPPVLASVAIVQYPKRLRKKGLRTGDLDRRMFEDIFEAFRSGRVTKDGILDLMEAALSAGKQVPDLLPPPGSEEEFQESLGREIDRLKAMKLLNPQSREKLAMGMVMRAWRGRREGAEIMQALRRRLQEVPSW
ncbi:MAG TPA: Glu-tRNA(Gln) amidotransferase subunit GatE [Candidatus Aminicenantes bacterium]|nr:Glu-tRNA(Gln) amidotransferase subunit GatE [Candidatus Aminicenantes bacterium]